MKKFIATILAVLYMSSSTGVTVHLHYCMGKLADWGLGHKESKICRGCGMEKNIGEDNGCCKDEHQFVKNSTDQKIVESSFQFEEIAGIALAPGYSGAEQMFISSLTEERPVSNAPPRCNSVATHILHCTFLI